MPAAAGRAGRRSTGTSSRVIEQDLYPVEPDIPLPIARPHRRLLRRLWTRAGPPLAVLTLRKDVHHDPQRRRHRRRHDRAGPHPPPHARRCRAPGSPRSPTSTSTGPRRWRRDLPARQRPRDRPGPDRRRRRRRGRRRLVGRRPTRSTCWPASPPASRSSARSRWPPPGRRASASSTPRSRPARRLVMVGFMRRYDDGYRAMKDTIDRRRDRRAAGVPLGAPQPGGPAARTPPKASSTTPACTTSTSPACCSTPRWSPPSVLNPRRSSRAADQLHDPLLLMLEMANGALVDIEAAVNIHYGYDIRGEVARRDAAPSSSPRAARSSSSASGQYGGRVPEDWRERFIRAYDTEFQEWIDAVGGGHVDRAECVGRLRRHGGLPTPACEALRTAASASRCRCASSRTSTGPTARGRRERTDEG